MRQKTWNCWTSAIAIGTGIATAAIASGSAVAQITPDNSLGSESSAVIPVSEIDFIGGGAIRGVNLFHSFLEFNVNKGRKAYFFVPNAGIDNVLTRVTGNNPSKILGILGTFGSSPVNLFLLNPNGIIFGQNASLDVSGSFVAATADGIEFGDRGTFSATNPTSPGLLTINPSALLFNQMATLRITNNASLKVPNGESLLLAGGDINLNDAKLLAPGGNIGLASLSNSGRIDLSFGNNQLNLGLPTGVRGDIKIYNTELNKESSGEIAIYAGNLDVFNSRMDSITTSGNGGDIRFDITDTISLRGSTLVSSFTLGSGTGGDIAIDSGRLFVSNGATVDSITNGSGKGGDITIDSRQFFLTSGSRMATGTFGSGKGGNLEVTADLVKVSGTSADGKSASSLFTQTFSSEDAGGDGGDLTIDTRGGRLLVTDGAQVSTLTFGSRKGGNLQVRADTVEIGGTSANGKFQSTLFTLPRPFSTEDGVDLTLSTGDGGDLTIDTRQLLITDGGQVVASTLGSGDGGNLAVTADRIVVGGTSTLANGRLARSGIFTQAEPDSTGEGTAGNLTINTRQLFVSDGAKISASTFSSKDAGDLTITAGQLFVTNGAQISSATFGSEDPAKGSGNGGNLRVNADRIEISGTSADGQTASGLFTQADRDSTGNAGDLTVTARQLFVTNGAQISASTFGAGNGGNLQVNADRLELDGISADGEAASGLFTQADRGSTGNAGDLTVTARQLFVTDGAQVSSGTFGAGNGGNLQVNADTVVLNGTSADGRAVSRLSTQAERGSTGNAGDLTVTARELFVTDGAQVSSSTLSSGNGGNLQVNADRIELRGISADRLFPSGLFTQADEDSTGNGGDLTIATGQLLVTDGATISAASLGTGDAGNIRLQANSAKLDNGTIAALTTSGEGGNLTFGISELLLLDNNSSISTTAGGTGNGGNMAIDTRFLVAVDDSDITANAFEGNGGNIDITAQGIFRSADSDITASSQLGISGSVRLNTPDIDPSRGLVNLPSDVVDASGQIAQTCYRPTSSGNPSQFIITGRGGLPATLGETTSQEQSLVGLVSPVPPSGSVPESTAPTGNSNANAPLPMEAQGWVVDANGEVYLVAQMPNANPPGSQLPAGKCDRP